MRGDEVGDNLLAQTCLAVHAVEDALEAVDIADAAPDVDPAGAVRYSIYNDPSGFMELEAVGGCVKEKLVPGTVLGVNITNVIKKSAD